MRKPGVCRVRAAMGRVRRAAMFEHMNMDSRMKMADLRLDGSAALSRAHYAATQQREAAQQGLKEYEAAHATGRASSMG
jgi:cytochrome c